MSLAWAVGYALAVWWLSTGVILYLDGLPRRTFATTLTGASVLLVLALLGLARTRHEVGPAAAACAFSCALLVWAWQEIAFLLGVVTGPRRSACPPDARGWHRFRLASGTVLHHELALLVLAVAVWLAVGDGANRIGWWTFLSLWLMRQSAKLNLFLGVRNHSEDFLPPHLKYLHSYFRRARMNALWPLSITATGGFALWVWLQALALPEQAPAAMGLALLGTLLALGAVEHALLVLPLPPERLWRWAVPRQRDGATTSLHCAAPAVSATGAGSVAGAAAATTAGSAALPLSSSRSQT